MVAGYGSMRHDGPQLDHRAGDQHGKDDRAAHARAPQAEQPPCSIRRQEDQSSTDERGEPGRNAHSAKGKHVPVQLVVDQSIGPERAVERQCRSSGERQGHERYRWRQTDRRQRERHHPWKQLTLGEILRPVTDISIGRKKPMAIAVARRRPAPEPNLVE